MAVKGFILFISFLCFFIAGYLCSRVMERLLIVKKQWFFKALLYVGCTITSNTIIYVGDLANFPPAAAAFLLIIYICCENRGIQKVAVSLMISGTTFGCSALLDNYMQPYHMAGRVIFWTVLLLLVRRLIPERNYELPAGYWKLLIVLTLTPVGMVTAIVLMQPYYYDERITGLRSMNQVLFLIALLSIVGLLWVMAVLVKFHRTERQKLLYEMNQTYYNNLEQQQLEVRKLRHDMANHFQAILSLTGEEKDMYIRDLIHSSETSGNLTFCENRVVNIVMNNKTAMAMERGINVKYTLDLPEKTGIARADLCTLFANSMDNAIESCGRLKKKTKEIQISARCRKGLLAFQISNPIEETPKIKEGKIESSKPDKKNHGFGLQSIREVTERYEGHMEMKAEEGKFLLLVWLKER